MRTTVAAVVLLGIGWAGVTQAQEPPGGPPPTPVRATALVVREVEEYRQVTGDLRARARSKVATIEPGLVIELPVREGDLVKQGEMLARLDSRRLVLELQDAEAQQEAAKATVMEESAEVARASRDLALLTELSQRQAGNPKELADAESDLRVAEARKEQAELNVAVLSAKAELLRTRLEDMVITAPFDGVVVTKETEVGQWVGQGEALVEIVSIGVFEAWLDVSQQYADAVLRQGVRVPVEIRALGKRFEPAAPRIIREVDRTARTFSVIVEVADDGDRLAPGMSVTGWVPTGRRGEHLMVPRDALLQNQVGFFVYVASQGPAGPAMATPVQVKVDFEHEDSVAVRPGALRAGDLVISEGNERLFPMMPVAVIEGPAAGAATPGGGPGEASNRGEEE
ncbi:MAG: efflux RND transporter periplasmic adaptor subunit [Phycisphaerales bacterium]|nr:MAG: efflux RND transporter periplasmic adaptor subunit [Phycisphaerales bacterium]